ncbi:MAG: hypothetical protein QOE84_2107 [Actinomycetota bacterium]|jgi:hypothetical protein|nr:hypothetical protein [Actinomycetota bacterium]
MRKHRALLIVTVTGVLLFGASPANATTNASPTHYSAPYSAAEALLSTNQCLPGATCRPHASASASGHVAASVDMSRSTNDQTAEEYTQGTGKYAFSLQAPRGMTKLTATFAWHLNSASSAETATHGLVFAGSDFFARATCGTCTDADYTYEQAEVSSSNLTLPGSGSASGADYVLTLSIDKLPTDRAVTLATEASAFADMQHAGICTGTVTVCADLSAADAGHSGTAHAELDAALVAVDLSYS